jgi:hypothetical protein
MSVSIAIGVYFDTKEKGKPPDFWALGFVTGVLLMIVLKY